jgi:hypothetical protein
VHLQSSVCVLQWNGADEYFQIYSKREPNFPPLAPPQVYELAQISRFQRLGQLNAACDRKIVDGVNRWMPVYRLCKDAILIILPGEILLSFLQQIVGLIRVTTIQISFIGY